MNKLSNAQVAEVLTDASSLLRAQSAQISELQDKLAERAQQDRVEKLASAMHAKGIDLDVSVSTLIERLEKTAQAGKLEAVEQAVDFYGPDMGSKIAQLNNHNHDEPGASSHSSALEQFIVGGVG